MGRLILSRRPNEGVFVGDDLVTYTHMIDASTISVDVNDHPVPVRLMQPIKIGKALIEFFFDYRARREIKIAITAPDDVVILREEIA